MTYRLVSTFIKCRSAAGPRLRELSGCSDALRCVPMYKLDAPSLMHSSASMDVSCEAASVSGTDSTLVACRGIRRLVLGEHALSPVAHETGHQHFHVSRPVQARRMYSTAGSSSAGATKPEDAGSSSGSTQDEQAGSSSRSTEGEASASGGSGQGAAPKPPSSPGVLHGLARDVAATLLPRQDVQSATRMFTGERMPEGAGSGGPTDLVFVKQKATMWQSAWAAVTQRFPFLSSVGDIKVSDSAAYKKGAEVAENLRERWETSDHPAVHKVEDYKERFFAGSESSRAMREIRSRDPGFDLNAFVQSVKKDGPPVVRAFLRHDMDTLRLHCGPELLERFSGIFKHFAEQGLSEDPTILFTGDVEIVEARLVDNDPWIIAQFHCQQLKCTRDKFGNVVEGSADSIQRVYYFWGLQQERSGIVTADGTLLPPRWVIKDMMWQSMLALV